MLAHAVLEALDFRRPAPPSDAALERICAGRGLRLPDVAERAQLEEFVRAFGETELCGRLARATQVRREQRFSFALEDELLVTGALDVVGRERTGMIVVDYKTDRDPGLRDYSTQQLTYALAVLLTGAPRVEVVHVFLERLDDPVVATFAASDRESLRTSLRELTAGVRARHFEVTAEPMRATCDGCPAEGGLCSWPLAMTRRERADQLF